MSRTNNVQNTRNDDTRVFLDPNVGIFFLSSRIDNLSDRLDALEAASDKSISDLSISDLRRICDEIAESEKKQMDEEEARRVFRRQEREKTLAKIRVKQKKAAIKAARRDEVRNSIKDFASSKRNILKLLIALAACMGCVLYFTCTNVFTCIAMVIPALILFTPSYEKDREIFIKDLSESQIKKLESFESFLALTGIINICMILALGLAFLFHF